MQVLSFRSRRLGAQVVVDRVVVRGQVLLGVDVVRAGGTLTRAFLVGSPIVGSFEAVLVSELRCFFAQLDKLSDDDHVFGVIQALDILTRRPGGRRAS